MKPMTSDELKDKFTSLPKMKPVEPSHNWDFQRWDLRQNVLENDPSKFLTWPGIVGTMYVGDVSYIDKEANGLSPSFFNDFIMINPKFGNPPVFGDGGLCSNLLHQAYHISRFEADLSNYDTIVEIGGGYGAMALVCHRLGFRGKYIIYDFPEFNLLQEYYLSNVGVDNVEFENHLATPRYTVCDLLIGLYSLSEIPLSDRVDILRNYPTKNYLIAYQSHWDNQDNILWASDMMRNTAYLWKNWNIPHMSNCWYLIGEKR